MYDYERELEEAGLPTAFVGRGVPKSKSKSKKVPVKTVNSTRSNHGKQTHRTSKRVPLKPSAQSGKQQSASDEVKSGTCHSNHCAKHEDGDGSWTQVPDHRHSKSRSRKQRNNQARTSSSNTSKDSESVFTWDAWHEELNSFAKDILHSKEDSTTYTGSAKQKSSFTPRTRDTKEKVHERHSSRQRDKGLFKGRGKHNSSSSKQQASSSTHHSKSSSGTSQAWQAKYGYDVDFEISDPEVSDCETDGARSEGCGSSQANWGNDWGGWQKYTNGSSTSASYGGSQREQYFNTKREEYHSKKNKSFPKEERKSSSRGAKNKQHHTSSSTEKTSFEEYVSKWKILYKLATDDKEKTFKLKHFPWPSPSDLEAMLSGPGISQTMTKQRHRQLLILMHPDKFLQKFGSRIVENDLDAASNNITKAAQILNSLL